MSKYDTLIAKKAESAQYMVDEITHICRDLPKRGPGSEGEKAASEYMEGVLKDQCGCETTYIETFKENPGSFLGWLYFTLTFSLAGYLLFWFVPVAGAVLVTLGFVIMVMQFIFYKKFVDKFFPEKTGTNVTAIKKCTGEVKARIFYNGHQDAAWNWPVNEKFGGFVYEMHILLTVIGGLFNLAICIAAAVIVKGGALVATPDIYGGLFWVGVAGFVFVPITIGLYFMWQNNTIVDGANDNLTGCYMGISILKAMKDAGFEPENVEVGVILSGSEEAGLRGSMAWAAAHKNDFNDVPTWIISYDTIHDKKFLGVNYRDLNGTVKTDKEVCDAFMNAAKELDIACAKTWVPPLGGATDAAAFTQGGFKATGITALNHVLEDYYHTRKDTYTNLNEECLADCYAISVKVLDNLEKRYSGGDQAEK